MLLKVIVVVVFLILGALSCVIGLHNDDGEFVFPGLGMMLCGTILGLHYFVLPQVARVVT